MSESHSITVINNTAKNDIYEFYRTLLLKFGGYKGVGAASDNPAIANNVSGDVPTQRSINIGYIGDSIGWTMNDALPSALAKEYSAQQRQNKPPLSLIMHTVPLQGIENLHVDAEQHGRWAKRNQIDVLVIQLGGNDALKFQDPSVTAEKLRLSIETIHRLSPDTRIFFQGLSKDSLQRGGKRMLEIDHRKLTELAAKQIPPQDPPALADLQKKYARYSTAYERAMVDVMEGLQKEMPDKIHYNLEFLETVDQDQYYKIPPIEDNDIKHVLMTISEGLKYIEYGGMITKNSEQFYTTIHPNEEGTVILAGLMAKNIITGPVTDELNQSAEVRACEFAPSAAFNLNGKKPCSVSR